MSRLELVSDEGLRVDGRRPCELRNFTAQIGIFTQADGSCSLQMGNTKCIAAVYGPKEPLKRSNQIHDRCTINVQFELASFATNIKRKKDKKLLEMASMVKQCFEQIVIIQSYPRSEIDIFIQIVQTDGGLLHSGINAACLALIDAGIPMTDYITSCSVGFANDKAILDMNYIEENAEAPLVTLAICPKSEKVLLLNTECRLHMDNLEECLNLAKDGCLLLAEKLDNTIREQILR